MGAIAPINFEKCLFAPIIFDKKAYCNHHFLSLMGANLLFITSLHPLIKNPKEGPGLLRMLTKKYTTYLLHVYYI